MYVEMLGHDASFGHIYGVKMTHRKSLMEKRVGTAETRDINDFLTYFSRILSLVHTKITLDFIFLIP